MEIQPLTYSIIYVKYYVSYDYIEGLDAPVHD